MVTTGFLVSLLAVVAIFLAAVVRGYASFGFSAFAVTSLSLVMTPAEVVPVILILQVVAGIHLLPSTYKEVEWPTLKWLLVGAVVATPMGVFLLAIISAETMRMLLCGIVLAISLLVWRGTVFQAGSGKGGTLTTGILSGAVNGAVGMGGLPVMLFIFSSMENMARSRSTLVAFFLIADGYALLLVGVGGLITTSTFLNAAFLVIPLVLGVGLGNWLFRRSNPAVFRRLALVLLMLLCLFGLIKGLVG